MTEPAKRLDLKLVSEDFTATAASPPADKLKAQLAASIREGRRRQKEQEAIDRASQLAAHQGALVGMKIAQEAELDRASKLIGKAAHRDGLMWGIIIGSALVALLALGAFAILKETVILNTATQRVNYPQPPAIQYEPNSNTDYERNPREPGN